VVEQFTAPPHRVQELADQPHCVDLIVMLCPRESSRHEMPDTRAPAWDDEPVECRATADRLFKSRALTSGLQKSGISACGVSTTHDEPDPRVFSAQTASGHLPSAWR
jgi:hypothetical protein